jgi:adenosylhomocysteine nucleosidase
MTIGIIGAMEEEVSLLKEAMTIEETVNYASMTFCKGQLCGKDVVIVKSGIGKVNAAICAQILVDKYNVDMLINTGIAGSLDAAVDIGDLVVSTDLVEHDMDASIFGDPVGQIPRMDTFSFPADPVLVEKAVAANQAANPDIKTFTGRIVSGDQFVSSAEVKERLVNLFGAKCTEMEGAAIAHAAYVNKVSCVILRAISDKADNSATMDYPTFEKKAIEHSVRLMKVLLPTL